MPTEARKPEMLTLLEVSGSKLSWKVVGFGTQHRDDRRFTLLALSFIVLGLGQILLEAGYQMVSLNTHAPNSRHNAALDSGAQTPLWACFTYGASCAMLVFAAKLQRKEDEN